MRGGDSGGVSYGTQCFAPNQKAALRVFVAEKMNSRRGNVRKASRKGRGEGGNECGEIPRLPVAHQSVSRLDGMVLFFAVNA